MSISTLITDREGAHYIIMANADQQESHSAGALRRLWALRIGVSWVIRGRRQKAAVIITR